MEDKPNDDWSWLTDRNGLFRNGLNLVSNVLFVYFMFLMGELYGIYPDYTGFKATVDCSAWKQVIDVAKTCQNGVRADLCYQIPPQNLTIYAMDYQDYNKTRFVCPMPIGIGGVKSACFLQ